MEDQLGAEQIKAGRIHKTTRSFNILTVDFDKPAESTFDDHLESGVMENEESRRALREET